MSVRIPCAGIPPVPGGANTPRGRVRRADSSLMSGRPLSSGSMDKANWWCRNTLAARPGKRSG